MKTGVIQTLMNEVALYGGFPLRRYDILYFAKQHLGKDAGEPFGAEYFAFHGPAVEMEPWPREAAAKILLPEGNTP